MIQQMNYLGVVVGDLEQETTFYRDILGLTVNEEESIPGHYTQFQLAGGATLSLQSQSAIPNGQKFEPAVQVDDVDATYSAWRGQGVEMLAEPHDLPFGRSFLFRTPAGQVFRAWMPAKA